MKKYVLLLLTLLSVGVVGCSINNTSEDEDRQQASTMPKDGVKDAKYDDSIQALVMYQDGTYVVGTEPDYEGYYSKATLMIKDGKVESIDWDIYDSIRNRVFDETYEEVFAGNEHYMEQCRNDLKGAKTYGPKLIENQSINGVDAISGATWANNKFKEVVELALEKAERK